MSIKDLQSKNPTAWPWFVLAGVLALLLLVLVFTTMRQVRRSHDLRVDSLVSHAYLQVRGLEDATRASMRRGMFGQALLQALVEETAGHMHVLSITILGSNGDILAQGKSGKDAPQAPLAGLPPEIKQEIAAQRPVEVFLDNELVVGQRFRPIRRFGMMDMHAPQWAQRPQDRPGGPPPAPEAPQGGGMMGPGHMMRGHMGPGLGRGRQEPQNARLRAYALLRLSTEAFNAERRLEMRRALTLTGLIFLAAGAVAWGLWATARHRGQEVDRLRRQVAEASHLAAVGRLAGSVAHEVRNPLSALRGLVQYLAKGYAPGSKEAEYASAAVEEVDRLERVVSGLLDYTRPQSPKRFELDLAESISGTLALMADDPRMAGIEVQSEIAKDLPPILADPDQVRQVIMNLLVNALEALDGEGRISIRAWREGPMLMVRVSDNGPGLPPEVDPDELFDPFFSQKERGTGLGLAIAKRIALAHGGQLQAGAAPGGGAAFTLSLPINGERT